MSSNDRVTVAPGSSSENAEPGGTLERRDIEIARLERTIAEERHAALTLRGEYDRLKKAYDALVAEKQQSSLSARMRRLFGR